MKVGFVGLGTMGSSMALNVRAAGYEVVVNDLRHDAASSHIAQGCIWAESIRSLGETSDVVLTSLPGPKEIEAVALGESGLLASMREGTTWFDLSTNSPTLLRHLHDQFAKRGIAVLDAPVSGGPVGAKSRKLAIWVGGAQKEFNRFRPLLDAIGDEPLYIGPIGAGSVAKLVHNCAGYAIQTALAEVFTLGVKAGVDPVALWLAVRQGALGRRRTFDKLPDEFLQSVYEPPSFALRLGHKDVTLATDLARELNVPMRLSTLALEDMTEALNRGWGNRDSRVPMLLQVERSGITMKVSSEQIAEARKKAR